MLIQEGEGTIIERTWIWHFLKRICLLRTEFTSGI
jgi:hypothetical protein